MLREAREQLDADRAALCERETEISHELEQIGRARGMDGLSSPRARALVDRRAAGRRALAHGETAFRRLAALVKTKLQWAKQDVRRYTDALREVEVQAGAGDGSPGASAPDTLGEGDRPGPTSVPRGAGAPEPVAVERAVRAGLAWLERHQGPDGSWRAAGFRLRCDQARRPCFGRDLGAKSGWGPGAGSADYDVSATALSVLAFLRREPIRVGGIARAASAGLEALVRTQRPDGSIGFSQRSGIAGHLRATLALCDAFRVTRSPRWLPPARRAVARLLRARNADGGWGPGGTRGMRSDTRSTGWAILALGAAREAGVLTPRAVFARAQRWFERVTYDGGHLGAAGSVGFQRAGDGGPMLSRRQLPAPEVYPEFAGVPTMTALATIGRLMAGLRADDRRVEQGLRALAACPPRWDAPSVRRGNRTSFAYWYAGTRTYQALAAHDPAGRSRWNASVGRALLGHQHRDSKACSAGSWDPVGEWGGVQGRVYSTALAVLTLEAAREVR